MAVRKVPVGAVESRSWIAKGHPWRPPDQSCANPSANDGPVFLRAESRDPWGGDDGAHANDQGSSMKPEPSLAVRMYRDRDPGKRPGTGSLGTQTIGQAAW